MKIIYSGIGSNKTKEHTENEFLNIMNREFAHKTWKNELEQIPKNSIIKYDLKVWDVK